MPILRVARVAFPLAVAAWLLSRTTPAHAQACCAGSGTVTPGRLALHERALVGSVMKAASVLGSWDQNGTYLPARAGSSELDLEQDLFGALRLFQGGQVALLVPFVETHRKSRGKGELGGGIGDVNASGRWDITGAGASRYVPGVALLVGVTLPTGKPADARDIGALATGATGIGAFQINGGLAVEQAVGPWLVSVTGLIAQRTARTVGTGGSAIHERLGPQWTALAAAAYVFPHEIAAALAASYTVEENATIDGKDAPHTSHRLPALTLGTAIPISDTWRVQTSLSLQPQVDGLGQNQPANAGTAITVLHSWF